MKAIILAGGLGTRLGDYTKDLPKCMLNFLGKPLLQHQVEAYRRNGIDDIVVVRKHLADKIQLPGVKYVDETDHSTHMVVGLFEARHEFDDDVIMSYGDVIFEDSVLERVVNASTSDVGILVDPDWKDYWNARFGDWRLDSESLVLEGDRIVALGKPSPSPEEMDARYVGMIRFSKDAWPRISQVYDDAKRTSWDAPWYQSKSFKRAYMTDFMQALIDANLDVRAISTNRGWLEFDTTTDYEQALAWHKDGTLGRFCKVAEEEKK